MSSFEDSLRYPMENDNWIVTVLIGGILGFLGFFIVPAMIAWGYYMEVMRETRAGNNVPPEFDDWGDLLMDGLKVFIIGFVYMLIPFIVFMMTVGTAIVALIAGSGEFALLSMLGGFMVSGVLALVFSYVAIAGIVNYSREGTIGSGFDIGTLTDVLTEKDYIIGWLIGVAFLMGANIVSGVIPIIGFFISPFITFYALTAASKVWSEAFDEALENAA